MTDVIDMKNLRVEFNEAIGKVIDNWLLSHEKIHGSDVEMMIKCLEHASWANIKAIRHLSVTRGLTICKGTKGESSPIGKWAVIDEPNDKDKIKLQDMKELACDVVLH